MVTVNLGVGLCRNMKTAFASPLAPRRPLESGRSGDGHRTARLLPSTPFAIFWIATFPVRRLRSLEARNRLNSPIGPSLPSETGQITKANNCLGSYKSFSRRNLCSRYHSSNQSSLLNSPVCAFTQAEYRPSEDFLWLVRYNCPFRRGTYDQLRRFTAALPDTIPTLSLDALTFSRSTATEFGNRPSFSILHLPACKLTLETQIPTLADI